MSGFDAEQHSNLPESDDEPPGEPTTLTLPLLSLHPPSVRSSEPTNQRYNDPFPSPSPNPLPLLTLRDDAPADFPLLPLSLSFTSAFPASPSSDVSPSLPAGSLDANLSFSPLENEPFVLVSAKRARVSRKGSVTRRRNPKADLPEKTSPKEEPREALRPVNRLVHSSGGLKRVRSSSETRAFRRAYFPDVADRDWNDWRWQTRHRVRTLAQIDRMLVLSDDERKALTDAGSMLPVGITPYYMSLLDRHDASQPLRRTVIPVTNEFTRTVGEADDPLGEDGHSPVPGLVHRYPDRVLLLALDFCSTYCRYCTRSRVVGHGELAPKEDRIEKIFDYLRRTPQVRDVLISGGDPLAMAEDKLDWILKGLRAIPHIEFVRIGTKMPAVLPQRITPQLTRVLRKYHPLWMSVHFLHPAECTPESNQACSRLADAGIPLGAQTVLLKGVNDDVATMKSLVHKLLLQRVRPYYLYQCDPISGSSHFRTPVEKGLEIIEGLRGHTTGYAVPTYVIDAPGGGGKIPLQPNYLVGRDGDEVVLRNFEGQQYRYPDPVSAHGPHERITIPPI